MNAHSNALLIDTAPPTASEPTLLERLAAVADDEVLSEDYACIKARCEHGVRSACIDRPTFGIVLRGAKRLHVKGTEPLRLGAGDLFMITRPCQLDAFNWPDDAGLYLTMTVPICDDVVAAARMLWAQPIAQGGPEVLAVPAQRMAAPLAAWADAMRAGAYGPARSALADMLVQLCAMGHTAVLAPPPPTLAAQIRTLVAAQPERSWRSQDFEHALGLSGATLRRRLAAEKQSLLEVITEARLACALQLLYTTRWPVKTVAARVGYRSAPTFARRFSQRYGLEPAQIGNGA
ncbi:MAG: AraC family transcriptional regulator [Proteobacteria bacterium]|nr:AraC family transcriptional regulator [Pseudomonadota bacterium]